MLARTDRDVVRQVLPEKRLAGLDPTLGVTRSAVANAARHTEGKQPVIIDLRNVYDPARMKSEGFTYVSVGRGDKD